MLNYRPLVCSLFLTAAASAQMLPGATAQTAAPAAPTTMPATNPAEVAAVRDAIKKYNTAVDAGDLKTLSESISVSTDVQKQAIDLMGALTTASRGLYQAAIDAYGQDSLTKNNVPREAFPSGYPSLPVDAPDVRVIGDKATISQGVPDGPPPLAMVKKDNAWKIDGDALLPPMTDKQMKEQRSVIEAAIEAINGTTTDVKAKHFRGPDEALTIMNFRVQKAVREAQTKLIPLEMPGAAPTTGPAMAPPAPPMP